MPRYKKKKHNRIFSAPKKRIKPPLKQKRSEDIVMTPATEKKQKTTPQKKMKVVAGRKKERSRRLKITISVMLLIALAAIIMQIILPAGIIQTASNTFAAIGSGSYPLAVSGSETLSVVPLGGYYFHLTDTHLSAYSNGGKILYSVQHGYEKPVLSASVGRVIIYNQGGTDAAVYDLRGVKYTIKTENEIICACISDSGYYAVATYSESYASAVTVYSKHNKVIYEWYSAEDIISSVALASSGKKLAVAAFNSNSGTFNSKVNVINYNTATPEYSQKFENQMIYGLKSGNKSVFCIIKSNGVDFVKWSNHITQSYEDDYNICYYRRNIAANVGVFSRESDKTDNKIVVFSKGGKVKSTVKYNGVINDIQVKGSNIYCISDTELTILDFKGNVKGTVNYGFGGTGVAVISANVAAVITDNEIKRIKF